MTHCKSTGQYCCDYKGNNPFFLTPLIIFPGHESYTQKYTSRR